MCRCAMWAELRSAFWYECGGRVPVSLAQQVRVIFSIRPGSVGYDVALAWAGSLDRDAKRFWGAES